MTDNITALNVAYRYAECYIFKCYAGCCCAECHYTPCSTAGCRGTNLDMPILPKNVLMLRSREDQIFMQLGFSVSN